MGHYDYIIIGAGAAGLMLANAMGKDSFFRDKSILLLDKDAKQSNDRTWCFWEEGKGAFDGILHKSWEYIYFGGQHFSKAFPIAPFTYKMVRGIDFYTSHFESISDHKNITLSQERVLSVKEESTNVVIATDKNRYTAKQVFNSIPDPNLLAAQKKYPVLHQHFLGWFVNTEKPVFNAVEVTFMDFSIPQKGNTRFMYVLPFSETEALVEYTLFSQNLLPTIEYETAIQNYLKNTLNCNSYKIMDKETGSIPMTSFDFSAQNTKKILNIGTAGGWTKASTGYTFHNTSKKVKLLIAHMKAGKSFTSFSKKTKFWYYDLLLLDILHSDNSKGQHIFETLFKNRSPQLILKFLEEETNFWEDLKIISGCPKKEFIEAYFNRLFKLD